MVPTQQQLKLKPAPLTQAGRILRLLKQQGEATNVELNRICFRYAARIAELRHDGHVIVTVRENNHGLFRFVYKGRKA